MPRRKGEKSQSIKAFADLRLERAQYDPKSTEHTARTREMFVAAIAALLNVNRTHTLDDEIATWIAHTLDQMLCNISSPETRALRQRGGVTSSLAVQDIQKTIAMYMQAARLGEIEQKAPIKYLRETFKCGAQTIRDYDKRYPRAWEDHRKGDALNIRLKSLELRIKHDRKAMLKLTQTREAIKSRTRK